jgi:hypothetical protein
MLIIGKALGHTSATAKQIYSQLDLDPVRGAVEKATAAMFAESPKLLPAAPRGKKVARRG